MISHCSGTRQLRFCQDVSSIPLVNLDETFHEGHWCKSWENNTTLENSCRYLELSKGWLDRHDLRCEGCLSLLSYCSTNYKTNRTNSKHANWVIYEHAARLFAAWNCLLFSLKWLESTKPKAAKVYSSILGSEMRLWMWCVAVGHCSQLVSFNNGHNSKASQSIQRYQTVHAKPHISL